MVAVPKMQTPHAKSVRLDDDSVGLIMQMVKNRLGGNLLSLVVRDGGGEEERVTNVSREVGTHLVKKQVRIRSDRQLFRIALFVTGAVLSDWRHGGGP
jgi:hypothetical protein